MGQHAHLWLPQLGSGIVEVPPAPLATVVDPLSVEAPPMEVAPPRLVAGVVLAVVEGAPPTELVVVLLADPPPLVTALTELSVPTVEFV